VSAATVLYISYDGLLEPLGQSQVLQYLRELARDHRVILLSWEKASDWNNTAWRDSVRGAARAANIAWVPLRYHKSPSALATSWDILAGMVVAAYLVARHRVEIIHARSYVASVIALALKRALGTRFIFDMRGFWPDEKVDAETWPANGALYRATKWFERRFLTRADVVVSLTEAGVEAMRKFSYLQEQPPWFEVITTCANLELFRPAERAAKREGLVIGYVGSVTGFYLFDPVLECFLEVRKRRPDARLRIVCRSFRDYIADRLRHHGVPEDAVDLASATHAEVPAHMARIDAGIYFIKQTYSKLSSSPTRLGEFLGCGVPVLTNSRVGDQERIIRSEKVGVILDEFTPEAQSRAVDALLALIEEPGVRDRCVEAARRHFSLDAGVESYRRIYAALRRDAAAPSMMRR
jgi:glycosyltransferase involved in cell wall biosynthesis